MIHGAPCVFVVTTAFPTTNTPPDGARATPHGLAVALGHVTVTVPTAFTMSDGRPFFFCWLTSTARSNVSSVEHLTVPATNTNPVAGSMARLVLFVIVTVVKFLNSYA